MIFKKYFVSFEIYSEEGELITKGTATQKCFILSTPGNVLKRFKKQIKEKFLEECELCEFNFTLNITSFNKV